MQPAPPLGRAPSPAAKRGQPARQSGRLSLPDLLVHAAVAACALLVLYLIKSALGVNLVQGYSLGLWGWFKDVLWAGVGWW